MKKIVNYFLRGLLVFAPIALTAWVIFKVFTGLDTVLNDLMGVTVPGLGLAITIVVIFLIGFLPSWPAAIPAARRLTRRGRFSVDLVWTIIAFSIYFWTAGTYLIRQASQV